eukprot:INCI668.6.p1 GENE.INCI668.6~~INCI668.6.p1  ORF type:complete len:295 (+),score=45.36 INCI668.6:122-886(+)
MVVVVSISVVVGCVCCHRLRCGRLPSKKIRPVQASKASKINRQSVFAGKTITQTGNTRADTAGEAQEQDNEAARRASAARTQALKHQIALLDTQLVNTTTELASCVATGSRPEEWDSLAALAQRAAARRTALQALQNAHLIARKETSDASPGEVDGEQGARRLAASLAEWHPARPTKMSEKMGHKTRLGAERPNTRPSLAEEWQGRLDPADSAGAERRRLEVLKLRALREMKHATGSYEVARQLMKEQEVWHLA